jgi:magnesium transporter
MPVRAFLYDSDGEDREVELTGECLAILTERHLLWIDLSSFDEEELLAIAAILQLSDEAVYNLRQKLRRPRLDNYGTYFHLNVAAICENTYGFATCELDFIVGKNYVLTAHRDPVTFLQNFSDQVKGDSQLGKLDTAALLSALLDWHITDYFRAIEKFEAEVDTLEAMALRFRSERSMLAQLVAQRRRASQIRRALAPHREVFAALTRPDFQISGGTPTINAFRTLNDRLERALETVDNARDLIVGTFDIFTTQTTQRTNHTIKLLTLVSVVLMPASVITGLMGMNFHTRLYDSGERGFWTVIACMAAVSGTALLLARKNRWI